MSQAWDGFSFYVHPLCSEAAETERDASPSMILADVRRESLGKATVVYAFGR
jgi:hypothetical protein